MMFKSAWLTIFIVGCTLLTTNAQSTVSAGISGSYNIPLETVSLGLRTNWNVSTPLVISPQLRYAPRFNDFHEISLGANLHYHFLYFSPRAGNRKKAVLPGVYALAGVRYLRWINYTLNINKLAKENNIVPEIGLGALLGKGRIKVFLEGKHNSLWMEPSVELGMLGSLSSGSKMFKCPY